MALLQRGKGSLVNTVTLSGYRPSRLNAKELWEFFQEYSS